MRRPTLLLGRRPRRRHRDDLDASAIALIVTEGGADMPALGRSLTVDEVKDVALFVSGIQ